MCKHKEVPIGKGCKPRSKWLDIAHTKKADTCEDHFWLYLNTCLGCGEKFHSARPNAKTCSDKCRTRLSRSRHATLFQSVMQFANGTKS